MTSSAPRFLTDPAMVVVDAVAAVEPGLARAVIEDVVVQVADTRTKLRRLARVLGETPDLLTTARPEGPRLVEHLIRDLREQGASRVVMPRCARCDRARPLRELDSHGRRLCHSCALMTRRAATRQVCTGCSKSKEIVGKGRRGQLLCAQCALAERAGDDYGPVLVDQLVALDTGLPRGKLEQIVERTLPNPFQRRDISWELDRRPELWTSNPALGSHRLVLLTEALVAHGAGGLAPPVCPFCGSTRRIRYGKDQARCCRQCYEGPRAEDCSRCGNRRHVATRTPEGTPICDMCRKRDPINHDLCADCGRRTHVVRRDGDRMLCRQCWRGPRAQCSICGQTRVCHFADTDMTRCEKCAQRLRPRIPCSRCGIARSVATRTSAGEPLCNSCSGSPEPCRNCGRTKRVIARTPTGPLCKTCYRRDPASFRTCSQCGVLEHLYHFGLCTACAADDQLRAMFLNETGEIPASAEPIVDVLATGDPVRLLAWISGSRAATLLKRLVAENIPITHETLDEHRHDHAVHALRAVLVDGGVLDSRDEHLAVLELWIADFTNAITDPTDRKLVRGFATWHHLRRLRTCSARAPITYNQIAAARFELTQTLKLLTWLHGRSTTLARCRQADIDEYLVVEPNGRNARGFVQWATKHGSAPRLDIPYRRTERPREPIESDLRWDLVKQLLHDHSLDPTDRLAGLLVLLYGQRMSCVVRLQTTDLAHHNGSMTLALGETPLQLVTPIDEIATLAVTDRRHWIRLTQSNDIPWLFPGGLPSRHLSEAHLCRRLRAIGIEPRRGRNAALIDLAAQLPAVVLSRLLGISVDTATIWASIGAISSGNYAATLMTRTRFGDSLDPAPTGGPS